MKLHFEANLDYQIQAVEAVCDLFRGQETCRTEFTVTRDQDDPQMRMDFALSDLGVGNRLNLLDDELLKNLRDVQFRNGLPPAEILVSGDFTVEMETGTGKTYVYLRTIFELNKRFGFTKFIIVVPSIAIKEGVYKTLQMTNEHFRSLYAGVPFTYFIYDSSELGQVRNFATSAQIQIMVMTVQSIVRRDYAVVYKESEKTGGEKPIDLIRSTKPILIVDEPQSVDGGLEGKGKKALSELSPLCSLRYSATHVAKHHMVYSLDALDAYERRLVKQIEVDAGTVENAHNRPFVRLGSVESRRGTVSAKVELDIQSAHGIARREVVVQDGDNLELTTGRAVYANCRIGEIRAARDTKFMELRYPGGEKLMNIGDTWGDVDGSSLQREMIRRTIREHLDKELRLRPQGIKVLSLFFIDQVAKYRGYDVGGNRIPGEYARIFEEEYQRAARLPEYNTLFKEVDLSRNAAEVHEGYFSIDKRGQWSDTAENNQVNRENAERAYNLIMKHKEKLLSFDTPLKFIFSHSALKEGWDNPNVFQICALREVRTERDRRQTIGRGLRLCVNQEGERLRGFDVNTLTVIANESFQEFAENLQAEIEKETGIRFGVLAPDHFAVVAIPDANGKPAPLGIEQSKVLWEDLIGRGYIDAQGKVQDSLKIALKQGTLDLSEAFLPHAPQIIQIMKKVSGRLEIRNADERRAVRPRQAILHSPEFKTLWERIKHKTTYRVQFNNEKLLEDCVHDLRNAPEIPISTLVWRRADIAIGSAGVEATERPGGAVVRLEESDIILPDLLTELQDRTQLTRKSLQRIVSASGRLDGFKRNPQAFIDLATEVINRRKRLALVDGIKYQRIGDDHYYAQSLFEEKELIGYIKNMKEARKSIYDNVLYESDTEARFADELENNTAVKVYAKLPSWFTVPTPLGGYNPDWALLVEHEGQERLYFVVETKADLFVDDLRDAEKAKITCGKAHFEAIAVHEHPAKYVVASKVEEILSSQ